MHTNREGQAPVVTAATTRDRCAAPSPHRKVWRSAVKAGRVMEPPGKLEMKSMPSTYEKILDHVRELEIIDTHEHLPGREGARDRETDFLREYLTHYFKSDLISCGLTPGDLERAVDPSGNIRERWLAIEPFWERARNTGYGRSLDRAVRELYGLDGIRRATIGALDRAFRRSLEPGHYRYVLKESSRIRVALLDSDPDCDRAYFRSVYRPDSFIAVQTAEDIRNMERERDRGLTSLRDWIELCAASLDEALEKGAVALKCGLAYTRSIRFEEVPEGRARRIFDRLLRHGRDPDVGQLQDHVMHHVLGLADARGLAFQFHTGIQEGNGNLLANSEPARLNNLFLAYPNVRFDIFHMGYPYQHQVSALAKMFPNVFIDMCWAHIISPEASILALREWLDSVPANKISAFGGDYCFVDGVAGHQAMARENISRALAHKVEEGAFDCRRAREIARMLFFDNPVRIFELDL